MSFSKDMRKIKHIGADYNSCPAMLNVKSTILLIHLHCQTSYSIMFTLHTGLLKKTKTYRILKCNILLFYCHTIFLNICNNLLYPCFIALLYMLCFNIVLQIKCVWYIRKNQTKEQLKELTTNTNMPCSPLKA